jgi:ribosomal protein S18 acetylase RimI-like enzyme
LLIVDMAEGSLRFYSYAQADALSDFLPILKAYLPFSNGLYNRTRAPHNLPSRHCLFTATFPPSQQGLNTEVPDNYTILFADRSRHSESQIWIFNPLITQSAPLSPTQQSLLANHLTAAILFLKDIQIPEAPGWPFSPILRFACLHEYFTTTLKIIAEPKDAFARATYWNLWNISTSAISSSKKRRPLPEAFTIGRVPEEQLDIVLSTSAIARQPSTMLMLPNVGVLNEAGKVIAWAYIGIDGSFATLYVLEEYRGRGLASYVAVELLGSYGRGAFADLGFDGSSGCVHSDVKVGNEESEGVMMSLGGKVGWVSSYTWVDSEKFS